MCRTICVSLFLLSLAGCADPPALPTASIADKNGDLHIGDPNLERVVEVLLSGQFKFQQKTYATEKELALAIKTESERIIRKHGYIKSANGVRVSSMKLIIRVSEGAEFKFVRKVVTVCHENKILSSIIVVEKKADTTIRISKPLTLHVLKNGVYRVGRETCKTDRELAVLMARKHMEGVRAVQIAAETDTPFGRIVAVIDMLKRRGFQLRFVTLPEKE